MKQDLNGVRTPQNIEQKYNLSSLAGLEKKVEKQTQQLTNTNNELVEFINSTTSNLEELQNQVDGKITTWFLNGVPLPYNEPAINWNTPQLKLEHSGDLYYDRDTGYAYRWSLVNDEYAWERIIDDDVVEALAIANAAKDTADRKRTIFVSEPKPPYEIGDIWIFNDSDLYRCSVSREAGEFHSTDWIIATKYTDDTAANNVKAELDAYKELVKTEYVTQTTFTTSNNEIKGQVRTLGVKIGEKNKIFTTQPVPPYQIGDAYVINDKIYTCINPKEVGEQFDGNDWQLNLNATDLVKQSTFNQTADEIRGEVLQIDNKVTGQDKKISTISQTVEEISAKLSNISDITTSGETSFGTLNLENINESEPIYLRVVPTTKNISYSYPYNGSYPQNDYDGIRILRFTNTTENTYVEYEIPDDLLIKDEDTYDEFILNYETETCQIIKRCEYNANAEVVEKSEVKINNYPYPKIQLENGNYTISLVSYSNGYITARLMTSNIYTTQFYTKVETDSKISASATNINLSIDEKLYKTDKKIDKNYDELKTSINLTESSIKQEVTANYTTKNEFKNETDTIHGEIELKIDKDDNDRIVSMINASADNVKINANKLELGAYSNTTQMNNAIDSAKNSAITSAVSQSNTSTDDKLKKYETIENNNAKLELKVSTTDNNRIVSMINASAAEVKINANKLQLGAYPTQEQVTNQINTAKTSAISSAVNQANVSTDDKLKNYETIEDTNAKLELKVDADDNDKIVSMINASADNVTIDTKKLNLKGYITATNLNTPGQTTINGSNITTGTIDATKVNVSNLDASNITTGTINADRIATNSITTDKIGVGAITADKISVDAVNGKTINGCNIYGSNISGNNITGGTITGSYISGAVGYIGGWEITNEYLMRYTDDYSVELRSDRSNTEPSLLVYDRKNNKYNWYVRTDGYMYATNAYVKGEIHATSGSFTGAVTATSGSFTGALHSSSGKIGCWNINSSSLYSTSGGTTITFNASTLKSSLYSYSVPWSNIIYAVNKASDKNIKNSIEEINDKYDKFYDELKPVTFKFNKEYDKRDYDKIHIGFIAQDVEEAQKNNELNELFLTKEEEGLHRLDKEEIIALNTWQIQKLKKENQELKEQLKELTEKVSFLISKESDK